MTDYIKIVEEMVAAWDGKDTDKMRSLLHKDYSFKGPMMEANSIEEALEQMASCPFEGSCKTVDIIVDGNRVVHTFDWHATAPFQGVIPMVEIMSFVDGKIKTSQMYYDTGAFPKDVIENMQQAA